MVKINMAWAKHDDFSYYKFDCFWMEILVVNFVLFLNIEVTLPNG